MNPFCARHKTQAIRSQNPYLMKQTDWVCLQNTYDYSPFGVNLDERTIEGDFYRRGFNGMEKDDELKGKANSYDFGARMYDSRVGRFKSLDAYQIISPTISHYSTCDNNPIIFIDYNGDYRMSPRQQKKYPELTNVLKNIQSAIIQDPNLKNAFLNSTNLTIEEANSILEWGKGPKISVKSMSSYGITIMQTGDIKINKKLIRGLEGKRRALNNGKSSFFNRKTTETKEGLIFLVLITIAHEGLHTGEVFYNKTNNANGEYDPNSRTTEDGNKFELMATGDIVMYSNCDKIAHENQLIRENILKSEKTAVNDMINVIDDIQRSGNFKVFFSKRNTQSTYSEKTSDKLNVNSNKIH